jgi:hypothetical protein
MPVLDLTAYRQLLALTKAAKTNEPLNDQEKALCGIEKEKRK